MAKIDEEMLRIIKERGLFSEYLPKSYRTKCNDFNIYTAGGSFKDNIEPYSYTMSRLSKRGDRRTIDVPEASAYVSAISFLNENKSILEDIADLSLEDYNSFSRIVNSDNTIVDDDGGYVNVIHPLGGSGDKTEEDEKQRSIFIDNMLYKIDLTKGSCGILHLDVSEFYRNIYTHAITAIKLGVEGAYKAYIEQSKDIEYKRYVDFDTRVRSLNGKRTNGLLVGPFLSKIISEAFLARVDRELRELNLVFTRYADDYEFAVYDSSEVKTIKSSVSSIFDKYFLKVNNEKTDYEEYPFYVFSNFEHILGVTEREKEDIEIAELFNRFWELEKKGEKGAIRYLLKAYQDKYTVRDESVYCNYLINVLCNDEKALALSSEILIREFEKKRIEINKSTKEVILRKLKQEVNDMHEWEVIWLVYLLKYTHCDISKELFEELWNSDFELLKVLLIHEYAIDKEKLVDCFAKSKSWILLYELALVLGYQEQFMQKVGINNSKNFYKKLFYKKFSFYEVRKNGSVSAELVPTVNK